VNIKGILGEIVIAELTDEVSIGLLKVNSIGSQAGTQESPFAGILDNKVGGILEESLESLKLKSYSRQLQLQNRYDNLLLQF